MFCLNKYKNNYSFIFVCIKAIGFELKVLKKRTKTLKKTNKNLIFTMLKKTKKINLKIIYNNKEYT